MAAINGSNISFTNIDHHLFRQEVDVTVTSLMGTMAGVSVNFGVRASSGDFADRRLALIAPKNFLASCR